MANGSKSSAVVKPAKPRPDFPLFPHSVGLWAKKVRGRTLYFGPWDEPGEALAKWLDEKEDLLAGRTPSKRKDGLTVGKLCGHFMDAKQAVLDTRELSPRTFQSYLGSCEKLKGAFGKNRLVEDLAAGDFEKLRADLAKGKSPITLRGDVLNIRMVFKYAYDNGLTEKPPRYGQAFKIPTRAAIRRARQAKGKRMFEAAELRRILKEASQPLRTMIYLGVNCGFGATDCANLPKTALNLEAGWVEFPRPKTAVDRRCALWPETVEALKEAISERPDPRDSADERLVFLTRCGQRWVRLSDVGAVQDAVANEMAKLLISLNLKREGLNFYALRHTLQTIGSNVKDQVALNAIFGHVDGTQAAAYREHIDDARLKAVSDFVRSWVFPPKQKAK